MVFGIIEAEYDVNMVVLLNEKPKKIHQVYIINLFFVSITYINLIRK